MTDADLVRDGVGGLAPPGSPTAACRVAGRAGDESVMSLVDHLSELRRRIAISLLAVFLGLASSASTSRRS